MRDSVDARSNWLLAKNYANLAWRGRQAHLANVLIVFASLGLLLIAAKLLDLDFHLARFNAPEWLQNYAIQIGVLWLAAALFTLRTQLRAAHARLHVDWLATLPIAPKARRYFACIKFAGMFVFELLLGAVLIAWLSGLLAAFLFVLIGAIAAVLVLAFAWHATEIQFAASAVVSHRRKLSQSNLHPPLQAWFLALLPLQVQMRWAWLLPLLLLPAAASLQSIAGCLIVFAAITRISGVSVAIGQASLQITNFLDASPLPANKLYQASWRFAAHAILPLLLIAVLIAGLMPLELAVAAAASVIALGVLTLVSQLHFSFAFRHLNFPQPGAHSESSAKARAWIIYLVLGALMIRELAPLLPIFCLISWRWFYLRGLRAGTGKPTQFPLRRL